MLSIFAPKSGQLRTPEIDAALFARALEHVLAMEGGYTEDPYDPGGPTNLGITLGEFARHRGQPLDAATFDTLRSALRHITRAEAAGIYRADYWEAAACPSLPAPLAAFHFDAAVNQGVAGAARMLQRSLGVEIDGVLGPDTLAAARAAPMPDALARYAEARRAHYRSLSTFWRFGRGWLSRVDTTLTLARSLAADPQFNQPPAKETPSMTDATDNTATPADNAQAPGKWWGQSMTIWGVIITSISTVLPVVGPLFGLNITAELIHQLGDGIAQVVQAVGGLVGTALTIWGRIRTSDPISRRQFTVTL